jgi:hypothetical protein
VKRPPISALLLLGALVLSASLFVYASIGARFFAAAANVDSSFYYARHYATAVLTVATPFALIALSLVIASDSLFVKSLSVVLILVTSYLSFAALFMHMHVADLGLTLFIELIIYWITGIVIFLVAICNRSANRTVETDVRKTGARG